MSLYTKYRPRDWNSVVGQELIVKILQSSLESNSTGHAYIFTGARGTGKTTSARIFAKAINCTNLQNGNPCHECENCRAFDSGNMLDVIEIDAASQTSVENIRELIEEANFQPMLGNYKIYIIDEVHMLSNSAFNALLKTLEEPPAHVKFILATTEIKKVLETILSRVHRFDFRKITESDIVSRLEFVANAEGISTDENALRVIAKMARGGMRNALTMLEQYTIDSKLSLEYLQSTLSIIDENFLSEILEHIFAKNHSEILSAIEKIKNLNIQAENFLDQMLFLIRDKMRENLGNENFEKYNQIMIIFRSAYGSLRAVSDELLIEMTLLQAVNYRESSYNSPERVIVQEKIIEKIIEKSTSVPAENPTKTSSPINNPINNPDPKIEKTINKFPPIPENFSEKTDFKITKTETPEIQNEKNLQKTEIPESKTPENPKQAFSYPKFLSEVKKISAGLSATLKTAKFNIQGEHISFTFSNQFIVNKINDTGDKNIIISVLEANF